MYRNNCIFLVLIAFCAFLLVPSLFLHFSFLEVARRMFAVPLGLSTVVTFTFGTYTILLALLFM